jgi:hypothetical protein
MARGYSASCWSNKKQLPAATGGGLARVANDNQQWQNRTLSLVTLSLRPALVDGEAIEEPRAAGAVRVTHLGAAGGAAPQVLVKRKSRLGRL